MINAHPGHALAIAILLAAAGLCSYPCRAHAQEKSGPYEANWESLDKHPVPQWFKDAKFGIFIHWGVYAVPAFHEWYLVYYCPKAQLGKNLGGPPYTAEQGDFSDEEFQKNIRKEANPYHRENFGVDFEYDQFIPMFKAENYDPEAWAELFKDAGAKYVVLQPNMGEEFAMWPSKFTERNSMDMGPHRDLTGDLLKAVRAEGGMKMGFYHNTTYSFWDERFPNKEWVEYMNNSIKELVDLYKPDLIWGDIRTGAARDENGKPLGSKHFNSEEVIAYFYNNSENPDEVLVNDRWCVDEDGKHHGDYFTPERKYDEFEGILEDPWELCDSLDPTSWGYNRLLPDDQYMTTDGLVDYLVETVSRGGNLLINVGPKADGTIPEIMQNTLRGTGDWLKVHGEAIYGTTHWKTHQEGPFRYTKKGDVLYAIAIESPGANVVLKEAAGLHIRSVELLGSDGVFDWEETTEGLKLSLPQTLPSPHANTVKIVTAGL